MMYSNTVFALYSYRYAGFGGNKKEIKPQNDLYNIVKCEASTYM
jgi:hypothetical protein